ncbi:MAG: Na/Pi cotransporter family protein [Eubacteriales bacterium]|nr:Na/Pi cotransporter family protein [Eubacteriales bacterium]
MGIAEVFGLLGGLALFLYGMQMMSDGLEDAAGNRMKKILERLTANRFLGVAVGAGITAVIQSSSATTVMVVGFVNSGIMTLKQAVWIIMGANIGTTITAQLITLDVGMMAPLLAFLGVAMIVFLKMPKLHYIGKIMAGFGILFIGMDMMGTAMEPLEQSETFISMMTTFSNPILGILGGTLFTALVQSSSAAVGILQALAGSGLIPFSSAVFVLFGSNIGTCITAVLAAIGTNRAAKRTTIIHLLFNVIGTIVFTILCVSMPVAGWVASLTPGNAVAQIANMHTIFNVATTCLLIPFGGLMASFAEKILPDIKNEARTSSLSLLTEEYRRGSITLGASAVHTDLLAQEIRRMITLAGENTRRAYGAVLSGSTASLAQVNETEELIDGLNKEISHYISKILVENRSGENVADIEQYFLITGNAERIGDHATNIAGYTKTIESKSITFSEQAYTELKQMCSITTRAIDRVLTCGEDATRCLSEIEAMEQEMDDMTKAYRDLHLERMRQGKCSEEACILYSELLTDFERIGDHILNIAQAYSRIHYRA